MLQISSRMFLMQSSRTWRTGCLLVNRYFTNISFFQYSRTELYFVVPSSSSRVARKDSKIPRNCGSIKKSRMVLTISWCLPVGSSMWQILFLQSGNTMLQRKYPSTFRSLSICKMGYCGMSMQMAFTMEDSPILEMQSPMEERLKVRPMPSTISSSPRIEYFQWTRVWSQRQQTIALSHTNQWMVSLMPKPSSLLRLPGSLKVKVFTSMKVKKMSSWEFALLTRMGIILMRVTAVKKATRKYSFFIKRKIQVFRREWSTSWAQTSRRARITYKRQRLPWKAQKRVRQVYLKSPQLRVKQLQVQPRGYISSCTAMAAIITMQRTGDRSFMGQQSLKMNHSDPILTQTVRMISMTAIQMQTLVLISSVSPRQYSHPQKN